MAAPRRLAWFVTVVVIFTIINSSAFASKGAAATSEGLSVHMMHYHHVDYAKTNLTVTQRVESAAKNSLARGNYFHRKIYGRLPAGTEDVVFTSPLNTAPGFGEYILRIDLGTPPRSFLAIADTGSDLAWIQCPPCTTCFTPADPIFNPVNSSTYSALPCTGNAFCNLPLTVNCSARSTCVYDFPYGTGQIGSSNQGDLVSDVITMTTTSNTTQAFPNFVFGCSHLNRAPLFGSGVVNGLVGLAQGNLSLVSQLGPKFGYLFSYCLVDYNSATSRTSPLLFGSTNGLTLAYTPLLVNKAFVESGLNLYFVNLLGITVNGVQLQYPADCIAETFAIASNGSGGLILDSGTALGLLDNRAYNPLVNRLASLIPYPRLNLSQITPYYDLCYNTTSVTNPTFPEVVFQFEGVNVTLPVNNTFLQVDDVGNVCLAFYRTPYPFSIFGNVQMQNFQIAFDLAKQRVGFLPRAC